MIACLPNQNPQLAFYDECIAQICPACPLSDAVTLSTIGGNCAVTASETLDAGRSLSPSCAHVVKTIFGIALDAGYDAG